MLDETLIDVDQVTLLISGENNFVLMVERSLVLDDVSDVLCSLHVVLASVVVDADVTHLLVLTLIEVSHSHVVVILVVIVNVWVLVILELLGELENNLLFFDLVVVGVDQHVLVVVGHVEVLLDFLEVVVVDLKSHLLLLDGELGVQML